MIAWLRRNSEILEGVGAIITAFVAVAALIGVKVQIDASARLAQTQSAREIYRDFLALSITHPKYAEPDNCTQMSTEEAVAYTHFFEYFLYTMEQVTAMDPAWSETFVNSLEPHQIALCLENDWSGYTPNVQSIMHEAQVKYCPFTPSCG